MTSLAAKFAALGVGMLATHWVSDHITGQTDHMAGHKTLPGPEGTRACLAHVASYTADSTATVLVLNSTLKLGLSPQGIVAGQLLSAVTHYWADRDRSRLARLSARVESPVFPTIGQPRTDLAVFVTAGGERLPVEVVTVDGNGAEKPAPFDNPSIGTGAYAIDQSWHIGWVAVAALLTAVIR